jgi:FkbM family methyltransferase
MTAQPFVSFAQNQEDVVLARALHPDDRSGFWIDVGAGDPVADSVTAAFSARGWRGINLEPLPEEFERICAARPHDVNLQVAVGATRGRARLYEGPPENRGSSTLVAEIAERYRMAGEQFEPIDVDVTTLADIVKEHAPATVDFLKIDVEGSERDVLEGADWSEFHPRIVVVEATEPNGTRSTHEAWESILLANSYELALFDGLNRFYASTDEPELLAQLAAPASVHDEFIPHRWLEQGKALAEAETKARRYHDRMAIALDDVAALRAELDASQRMTARALTEMEEAQRDAAAARQLAEDARGEVDKLLGTRLLRYTAPLRRAYGRVRGRKR